MTDAELQLKLEKLQSTMISVATGGPQIDRVNGEFRSVYAEVAAELAQRGIPNPLPFQSLWDWHGRWQSGDMPKYRERREYVSGLFRPLADSIRDSTPRAFQPTGWERVDRVLNKCRQQLATAESEEDFQAIGLHCREILISLAQVIWDPQRHPPLDQILPSETDVKRKLDAFIAVELASGSNDHARKHARASLDLAVALQHRRTAQYRDAAMCLEGTTSVVNLLAIVQGRRDPVAATSADPMSSSPQAEAMPLIPSVMVDAAEDFSTNRTNLTLVGGLLPAVLAHGPRLLLHLVPISALQEGAAIDHEAMQRFHGRFKPAHYETFQARTNIDGWQLWQPPKAMPPLPNPVASWCSMVTNTGIIEVIEVLATAGQNDPPPSLKGYPLEADIVVTLDQIAEGCRAIGIASPAILKAMLFGVQGVRLERSRPGYAEGFDRPFIRLPDVHVEQIAKPLGGLLRPMFDALWRAAGWPDGSQSFSRGEWAGYGDGRIR